MPHAAWEAMLAHALHPKGIHNLPAPQADLYVLTGLQETLQETRREGGRLWDITQNQTPRRNTPSPPRKGQHTKVGSTHTTLGVPRATHHDARDPPASGATT